MAKIRNDYQESRWARFLTWMNGEETELDRELTASMDEEEGAAIIAERESLEERIYEERNQASMEKEKTVYEQIHKLTGSKSRKAVNALYTLAAIVICISIIAVLLRTASYLPAFGHPENPVNNEVSRRYIESGMKETGAVNIVAGMILDYRAFDTLGESNVLFIAVCSVMILLRVTAEQKNMVGADMMQEIIDDRHYEPKNDMILQFVTRLLFPLVLMLGVYIIMNGHITPGGGFSGGAVMGAGLILFLSAFGFAKTERFFTVRTFRIVSVTALSFYALSKAYSFFTGANHFHSIITPGTPGKLFSAGLIPYLNIAVGLVVCCTMYAFYTLFRKGDM